MNKSQIDQALREVARRNGTTPEAVRKEIAQALAQARASDDPKTRAAWAAIPHTGAYPTVEEVFLYIAHQAARP